MNKVIETEENGVKVTYEFTGNGTTLSGDSFGPMLLGFPFTKVSIVQQRVQSGISANIEREVIATLAMPTTAFLELADNIRKTLKSNQKTVEEQTTQALKIIFPD